MSSKNLGLKRGDTNVITITVKRGRERENLSGGDTLYFTCKRNFADADSAAVIRKSSGGLGGIVLTDPVEGEAQLTILPADTSGLSGEDQIFPYDIQLLKFTGEVRTIAEGSVIILPDVTVSTS